jgi:hypothetical protein
MKKQLNEIKRLQQLAGVIKESQFNGGTTSYTQWKPALVSFIQSNLTDDIGELDMLNDVLREIIADNEQELADPNNQNYLSENIEDEYDNNLDWNKLKLLGTEKDFQGTWVIFLDPEDPYAEEEGYSFAVTKRQIEQVKNGEQNGVEDGSNISYYMSKQDAENILSKI